MRHYAKYDEDGITLAVGVGLGGIEITAEEYNALLAEIREKAELVEQLYNGEIASTDVPEQWRAEVERRVAERIEREGEAGAQEISGEELAALLGEVL